MYLGPALLAEIFLVELSGDNIKVHAAEVSAPGEKGLEQGGSRRRMLQGDVESGSRWLAAGNRRMLVAGRSSSVPHMGVLTDGSFWLGDDPRRVADCRTEVYSGWSKFRRTRLSTKVDRPLSVWIAGSHCKNRLSSFSSSS